MPDSSDSAEHKSKSGRLLKFLLFTLPLAILGEWQLFERQKTLPQWWADKGLPSMLRVAIVWAAVASLIALFYYLIEILLSRRSNRKKVKAYRAAYQTLTLEERLLLRDTLVPFGRPPGSLTAAQLNALNSISQKTAFIISSGRSYELNPSVKGNLTILLATDRKLKFAATPPTSATPSTTGITNDDEKAQPIFECENDTRFIPYGMNLTTKKLFREPPPLSELQGSPDNITIGLAALAQFYFREDNRIAPTLYLCAHVNIYDANRDLLKHVIDGVWEGPELKRSKHIKQGRGLELMVALIPLDGSEDRAVSQMLYTLDAKHYEDKPETDLFSGSEFFLTVELLSKTIKQKTFSPQSFHFKLSLQPEPRLVRVGEPPAAFR